MIYDSTYTYFAMGFAQATHLGWFKDLDPDTPAKDAHAYKAGYDRGIAVYAQNLGPISEELA